MLIPLTSEQQAWVEKTLAAMSMEECVGHLLCPEDRNYQLHDWRDILHKVPLGSVFIGSGTRAELAGKCRLIQAEAKIPVLVASDMENGAILIKDEATHFPAAMGVAATGNPEMLYQMGRITALESRSCGIHWTFSPVVDLNLNFNNPVTNIRSLGDRPERTIPLLRELIRGLQQDGLMAATAKHFPGDGVDDRDQHMCTSVNSLPKEQWFELYGRVWQAAIDAGVMSIMAGHIAFPDWQGCAADPEAAMPATLSPELQVDLLRNRLGFKGVLVSDAAPMTGLCSRAPTDELAWRNIAAGSDMFLFADPVADFARLMAAVRAGKLSEKRVMEATRRVLEMKARLNLHIDAFGPEFTDIQLAAHGETARQVAEASITQVRVHPGLLPARLAPGAKVLTVTMTESDGHGQQWKDLTVIDDELRRRGIEVDHQKNPGCDTLFAALDKYERIFVNFYMIPHLRMGLLRLAGAAFGGFWKGFYANALDKVVFTSFGTPYVLHEQPHLNNLLLAYSPYAVSQRAAVRAWLGEITPAGICPVRLPKVQVRRFPVE